MTRKNILNTKNINLSDVEFWSSKSGNRFQNIAMLNKNTYLYEWKNPNTKELIELANKYPDEKVLLMQITGLRSYSYAKLKNLFLEIK